MHRQVEMAAILLGMTLLVSGRPVNARESEYESGQRAYRYNTPSGNMSGEAWAGYGMEQFRHQQEQIQQQQQQQRAVQERLRQEQQPRQTAVDRPEYPIARPQTTPSARQIVPVQPSMPAQSFLTPNVPRGGTVSYWATVRGVRMLYMRNCASAYCDHLAALPEGRPVGVISSTNTGWFVARAQNDQGAYVDGYVMSKFLARN